MVLKSSALFAFFVLTSPLVNGDDFLLRLETSGFRDSPANEKEPPIKPLESIEVLARVNETFFGKSTTGPTTVVISGQLEQRNDGKFRVHLKARTTIETGEFIGAINGAQLPITKSTNVNTTVVLDFQKPAELNKADSSIRSSTNGATLKTLTRSTLTIDRFSPAKIP